MLFVSNVLPNVRLVEADDGHWVCVAALRRRLGRHPESQWQVRHGVGDDALVLVRVLRDPAQAGLDHVVSVEELLLRRRLQPDLVLRVRRQVVEGGHVQTELARLRELAEAGAEREEVGPGAMGSLSVGSN